MGTLDFGMKFGNYATTELIALANNTMQLTHLDHEDMCNLVKELSDRLEAGYVRTVSNPR
jgi:hypothetical protein